MNEQIKACDFLHILERDEKLIALDVRSEDEFERGAIPQSLNIPILNNSHRKTVGITYKMMGQEEAIKIGHELVDPIKKELVEGWRLALQQFPKDRRFLYCWRGGLRSQMAASWLAEEGFEVRRIEGGHKAIRHELLQAVSGSFELILLTGLTGSGKTKLLQRFGKTEQLDLEDFANHRGSAFGPVVGKGQPAQQTFENLLGMRVFTPSPLYVVEHEGNCVGRILVPPPFVEKMRQAPLVYLEKSMDERIAHIFSEYITLPLSSGMATPNTLREILLGQLSRIKRRLGMAHYSEINEDIITAFQTGLELGHHEKWIHALLIHYYDRLYNHAIEKSPTPIIFRGKEQECFEFLQEQLKCAHKNK